MAAPRAFPGRAGWVPCLVLFGGSFSHAVALTRQHVVDASRGDLAVRRSNSRGQVGRLCMRSGHEQRTRSAHVRAVRKSVLWCACHVNSTY